MEDVEKIILKINTSLGEFSIWILKIISVHPYVLILAALVIIYLMNHLVQKRFQTESFNFHNAIFFIIGMYLLYLWFNNETYLNSINEFLVGFEKTCAQNYKSLCSYTPKSLSQDNIILMIYTVFLIAINSRLMWIISVVVLEAYFVIGRQEDFYAFFNSIPEKREYLFKGTIPFILASPILLVIWVFRDNDRYQDISNKKRELDLKERELSLRSKEYELSKKRT